MNFNIEPEERDGYLVDTSRKKLWKIELEIMEDVKAVCDSHKLHYFLIGGTAIGAIRHKGFIPWDDDLDIGMIRTDFDMFLKYAQIELGEKYAIQYGICGDICTALLRIRDKNTTGILKSDRFSKQNQGIFIEIYPFDNVPDNEVLKNIQYKLVQIYSFLIYDRFYHFKKSIFKKILILLYKNVSNVYLWKRLEMICRKYNGKKTKRVDTIMLTHYANMGIHLFDADKCKKTIKIPFENTELEIAIGNDDFLRQQFGNYMQLPPIELRGTHHDNAVFYDTNHPYEYWINNTELNKYFK